MKEDTRGMFGILRVATPGEMVACGREAGMAARAGEVHALVGPLGAGKTHWTKGFAEGLGCVTEVTSPTFGLVHEHREGRLALAHLDFYRLESAEELLALGWDELLESGGVVVAEWADRFPELLPADAWWHEIRISPQGGREIRVSRQVPRGDDSPDLQGGPETR